MPSNFENHIGDAAHEEVPLTEPVLPELFTASDRTIQTAHDNYPQFDYKWPQQTRPESRNSATETRKYDPRLLQYAFQVAGGDSRRVIQNPDGSITIANNPQR